MQKYIYHISRIFVGIVFLFSGFVKAVDPMGTAIKFSDYFNYAFNLPDLTPLSLPLSLIMCGLEFSLGVLLIFNLLPKVATWLSVLLMLVFTPLTFYLAVANPVSDCGCFGDAVKLSNWETFWKNIVIDIFLVFLFMWRKKFPAKLPIKTRQIISTILLMTIFGFEFFNYSYLPIIDFRPYKVGNNIKELMEIPDDAEQSVYETSFVYKNIETNETKTFNEDNYPYDDSTWVWVETNNKLVKQGYVAPIHDFKMIDLNGNDITDYVLSIPDTAVLVVTYTLEEVHLKNMKKVKQYIDTLRVQQKNLEVFCVTSSGDEQINLISEELEITDWTFCKIDEVTSKTIIRSNPGVVLLQNGKILNKFHHHSLKHQIAILNR